MSEQTPELETSRYKREQVVETLRKLAEKGFTHPDDLPADDSEVAFANELLDGWTQQQEALAKQKGTKEADLEFSLDRSTIFVDAGFSHPDYLDEVANDWLAQDLQTAEDFGLSKTAAKIQAKIKEIETK